MNKQLCFSGEAGSILMHPSSLPIEDKKSEDFSFDEPYHIVVPYRFKWRAKLGKATCDCVNMRETFQPYYGFTWFHENDCAVIKHLKKWPQMENFFWDRDPRVIANSD